MIALLVISALIMSSFFVTGATFDIRNALKRLTTKMTAVSHGDLKVPDFMSYHNNDLGTLYVCFNSMNGILKKLSNFIDHTANATQDILQQRMNWIVRPS